MTEYSVEVSIKGHYLLKSPDKEPVEGLIVGFHGYGENAEVHLERMEQIPGADRCWLCSIQALHPFYLRKTGEVVASWMTRFHREQAIRENKGYVDQVLEQLRKDIPSKIPLVLFGFSQGAAMAYRAAISLSHPPEAVIILGGDLPPDLADLEALSLPPILIGRGARDKFYLEQHLESDVNRLKDSGMDARACQFDGEHGWNDEFGEHVRLFLDEMFGR